MSSTRLLFTLLIPLRTHELWRLLPKETCIKRVILHISSAICPSLAFFVCFFGGGYLFTVVVRTEDLTAQ